MIDEIRVFLSNVFWMFKNVFFRNKKIFNAAKPYLASGLFRNSLYSDYIYEVSHQKHFENLTFSSSSYQNFFAKKIISCVTSLMTYKNCNSGDFGGTEIIISSSLREYKIFNVEKKVVLTLYLDRNKMNRVFWNKKNFSPFFNVVKTLEINSRKSFCIEEFINHKNFDKEKAFLFIAKQYAFYARNKSFNKDKQMDIQCLFFAKRFGSSKLLSLIKDFPIIFTHGDLWKSNVIYDGLIYYVTDFEAAKSRFFLYDLFCFIFTEYVIYDDLAMIQNYFQGKYDDLFSNISQSVDLVFEKNNRDLYFLAYLVTVLNERWKNYFGVDDKISRVIKDFIPNYNKK